MMPPGLLESVDLTKAIVQKLRIDSVNVDVLRLDLIHPIISGNKWFKLKYHLKEAKSKQMKGIVSFGGAYSNHLLAVACACARENLLSAAIIRGEEPGNYAPTLSQMKEYGMQMLFTGREAYKDKTELKAIYSEQFDRHYWVNEGGQSELGVLGASEILQLVQKETYTYIACAAGTGTMAAGLIQSSLPHQKIIVVPVLKIGDTGKNELKTFIEANTKGQHFDTWYEFHEGGYAKKTSSLIEFMTQLNEQYAIPTDFVYTGKLFKAILSKIKEGYFPTNANILVIHSGGLQGNRSLSIKEQQQVGSAT